jgi:hypothetical protein
MDLFCKEVGDFLDNLDYHVPFLLRQTTMRMLECNILEETGALFLHSNEYALLNRIAQLFVKTLFNVDTLHIQRVDNGNFEYMASDLHMEFELSDKCLEYIKSIVSSRRFSIINKNFVFIIKQADSDVNRNVHLGLRRIMDINPYAKFIITSTSASMIEKSLLSRTLLVNCSFPFDQIMTSQVMADTNVMHDETSLRGMYHDSHCNIITFLQNISSKESRLMLWQSSIDKLFSTKHKKHIDIIHACRETAYKLYHIGIRLADIARYIINKHVSETPSNPSCIVNLCAECEHRARLGCKDILVYERLLLKTYLLIKR